MALFLLPLSGGPGGVTNQEALADSRTGTEITVTPDLNVGGCFQSRNRDSLVMSRWAAT
jgi:hypothetical protein